MCIGGQSVQQIARSVHKIVYLDIDAWGSSDGLDLLSALPDHATNDRLVDQEPELPAT